MDDKKIRFIDDSSCNSSVDKEGYDDDIESFSEKHYKQYIRKMKDLTRRNTSVVLSYYTSFVLQFPDGRMNRDQFLNKVVDNLVVQTDKGELVSNKDKEAKIEIFSRLFDICDRNADGKVDLVEVTYFLNFIFS